MKCAWCKNSINSDNYISGAGSVFCSDLCILRFYKEELPNLGGDVITNKDIEKIKHATGRKRKQLHDKIMLRFMDEIETSKIMTAIKDASENGEIDKEKIKKLIS